MEVKKGMISKSELAQRYFPNASTPSIARTDLMRVIKRCSDLNSELLKNGYKKYGNYFTPKEVRLIEEYLGEP